MAMCLIALLEFDASDGFRIKVTFVHKQLPAGPLLSERDQCRKQAAGPAAAPDQIPRENEARELSFALVT